MPCLEKWKTKKMPKILGFQNSPTPPPSPRKCYICTLPVFFCITNLRFWRRRRKKRKTKNIFAFHMQKKKEYGNKFFFVLPRYFFTFILPNIKIQHSMYEGILLFFKSSNPIIQSTQSTQIFWTHVIMEDHKISMKSVCCFAKFHPSTCPWQISFFLL